MTAENKGPLNNTMRQASGRERFIIAAVFVLLFGAIAVFSVVQYQKIISDARMLINTVSIEKVGQIRQWRDQHLVEAEETTKLSDTIRLIDAVAKRADENDRIALLSIFSNFAKTYGYAASIAVRPDFSIALSSSDAVDLDQAAIALLPKAAESRSPMMTELHTISPNGKPGCNIVLPVFDYSVPGGRLSGFIVHYLEAQRSLYPIIDSWPVPSETAENILIRRDGNKTVFLSRARSIPNSALNFTLPFYDRQTALEANAAEGKTGFLTGRNYQGKSVIGVARAIEGTDWILVSEMETTEVLRPWLKIFVLLGIILVIGMAAAIFSGTAVLQSRSSLKYKQLLESEKKLRAAESKFSIFMDHMPLMVMIKDEDSQILFANKAMVSRFLADAWLGKRPEDIFDAEQAKLTRAWDRKAMAEGYVEYEETRMDKSGQLRFLLAQKFPIIQDGEPRLLGQIMSDVTERNRSLRQIQDLNATLEEKVRERTAQLEASNLELQTFTYSVSHDLRSPLRALDGYAELLAEGSSSVLDDKGMHYIERIRGASARMAELINDLLSLSKVSNVVMKKEKIDIGKIADSIISEYIRKDPNRIVSISIKPSMLAICDELLIDTLFRTLIDNAFKFSSGRPRTIIEVGSTTTGQKRPGDLVYYVRDQGVGFDMSYKDKLFQPFHRIHGADEFPGNGIGLSIAKRIIDRHGGSIWLESEPGFGTTAYFCLGTQGS